MHQLAGRLTALDPDAGEALRVIAYFDELVHQRSGLESVVRGAAVLTGAAARLSTPGRRVALRVTPSGIRDDLSDSPDPKWQSVELDDPDVTLWLERHGPSGPVDAMVLERGAQAARTVLDRTRGRQSGVPRDGELVELLLDPDVPPSAREVAQRTLGFHRGQRVRVAAGVDRMVLVLDPGGSDELASTGERLGFGPPVPIEDVASTARSAQLALRLTSAGDATDPGERVVWADRLGAALLLAEAAAEQPAWADHPDVRALAHGAGHSPWFIQTLSAVGASDSLRAAASVLAVHHSTLQQRLGQIEKALGWNVMTPSGRLRLQVALMIRRLGRGHG